MFTGIIEETGQVLAFTTNQTGARLRIGCAIVWQDLATGDSVCVNGVCLTAVDLEPGDPGSIGDEVDRSIGGDPLGFVDVRAYPERLAVARAETGEGESVVVVRATVGGVPCVN